MPERPRQTLRRYTRGMTALRPPRPVYGWRITCSCGWEHRSNGTKGHAGEMAGSHAAAEHPIVPGECFLRLSDGVVLHVSAEYPGNMSGDWLAWRVKPSHSKALRVKPARILNPLVYEPVECPGG